MDVNKVPRKLWEHPNVQSTALWKFKEALERESGQRFQVRLP